MLEQRFGIQSTAIYIHCVDFKAGFNEFPVSSIFPFIRILLEIYRNTNRLVAETFLDVEVGLRYFLNLLMPLELLKWYFMVQLQKREILSTLLVFY